MARRTRVPEIGEVAVIEEEKPVYRGTAALLWKKEDLSVKPGQVVLKVEGSEFMQNVFQSEVRVLRSLFNREYTGKHTVRGVITVTLFEK